MEPISEEEKQEDRELKLIIQPKVIDHLGIKMYQKPVDVIAEFIANTWDADSETADVTINNDSLSIKDTGIGMTYQQCQDYFLTVGRDRRKSTGKEITDDKKRPILGRKGIGKFAGFGIAKRVEIMTVSKTDGETTCFVMDIQQILDYDAAGQEGKPITVTEYKEPSEERKKLHGTVVSLNGINGGSIDIDELKKDLSRRFLLPQMYNDFKITVNNDVLPESFSDGMEFVFPRDLTAEEKNELPALQNIDETWAVETLNGHEILWRIGFYEEPIETEELRGISVFARGKMAQKPFFFEMTGGINSQFGIEYMTGQIKMDFIDTGDADLIATERQRINLQTELGKQIKAWGQERIKFLSSAWKERRRQKKLDELNIKVAGFKDRLDALKPSERKTVKAVLLKIASFQRLGQKRFHEWCNDILTSWETGRLRELIAEMSQTTDLDEQKLLDFLAEADVLTALNIAESIKTKIISIGELKQRVLSGQLENKVRDYIYDHPWIVHPKWESFKKERSVEKLIKDLSAKHLKGEAFNGRVDLTLSAGSSLLLVEFMRPGLELDTEHLDRINYYVIDIRSSLDKQTAGTIRNLENAYLIADSKKDSDLIHKRIKQLEDEGILVMTWDALIEEAIKQWKDYLDLLKLRNPDDKRIRDL
ncbi:MAG: ATP-binding protein [Dissulfurispiraceae bacterium]